jgi:hypothetical protein
MIALICIFIVVLYWRVMLNIAPDEVGEAVRMVAAFALKIVGILLVLFLLCFAYIELIDKPQTARYYSRHCVGTTEECSNEKYRYGAKMTVDETSNLLNAYHSGKMKSKDKQQFEDDVYSGLLKLAGSGISFLRWPLARSRQKPDSRP